MHPNGEAHTKMGAASLRFMIAGGGTGGHIFPALAIAGALKAARPEATFLFVGAEGKMEMEKVPAAGYEIVGLPIAGFNRSSLVKNIGLPFKMLRSFLKVRSVTAGFRPDAVIGVGGYSSFPVLKYAQTRGIPTFIHESNAFAGKANKMLGRGATRVFVAAEGMEKFFPAQKISRSGNPVRESIAHVQNLVRKDALKSFGLSPAKKTLLAVGGSLGAKSINAALADGLDRLIAAGLQVIWQTGKVESERWNSVAAGKQGVWVSEFITGMETAYAAADLIVSRAGAMAVAELQIVGKPVVFLPYPHAAEDHQTHNAKEHADRGAALLVKDNEAGAKLIDEILRLASHATEAQHMGKRLQEGAVYDAGVQVAQQILKDINR